MLLVTSPTELTTSATDAVLAAECFLLALMLGRGPAGDRQRLALWRSVFGLLASASLLGAVVHGFELRPAVRAALWHPLYLSLGLVVALFLAGAIHDYHGWRRARRLLPWLLGLGLLFFTLTALFGGSFGIFVVYEALAMTGALALYLMLALGRRLQGAGLVAVAIVLTLVAAGVQASDVSFTLLVPFDHNGAFHLLQMAGLAILGLGLRRGMQPAGNLADGGARPVPRETPAKPTYL